MSSKYQTITRFTVLTFITLPAKEIKTAFLKVIRTAIPWKRSMIPDNNEGLFHPLGLRSTLILFGLAQRELRDGIWKLLFKASHFIFFLNVEFQCPINWYWHAPLVNPIATFYISYFRGWLNFFKDLGILAKFCRVSWGNTRWQCSV